MMDQTVSPTQQSLIWWKRIRRAHLYTTAAVICVLGLVINYLRPLNAQPGQWADDALYFRQAVALSKGEWLGTLDPVLLSKAPGYALFVSSVYQLGIPLRLAEWLLMVMAVYLWGRSVRPVCANTPLALVLGSIFLMFIPAVGTELPLGRTTIFGTAVVLTLICVGGFMLRCRSSIPSIPWAVGSSLFAGLCSVVREEASWLFMPIGLGLILSLRRFSRREWTFFLASLSLGAVTFKVPSAWVSYHNSKNYSIPSVSLRQDDAFRHLYNSLVSSAEGQKARYVPVPEAARLKLYGVSPTFAELQPILEGTQTDDIARNLGHHHLNHYVDSEREFFVSNFEFALSRAIWLAGYQTGSSFRDFCLKAATEIELAQKDGKLNSDGFAAPMIARFGLDDIPIAGRATFKSIVMLITGSGIAVDGVVPFDPYAGDLTPWYAFTRTWPHTESENSSVSRSVLIWLGSVLGYLYPLVLGSATIVISWRLSKRQPHAFGLFALALVGASGLLAFSLTIGLADTIAFPILQWPMGYNRMGYFPLHMCLLFAALGLIPGRYLSNEIKQQPSCLFGKLPE